MSPFNIIFFPESHDFSPFHIKQLATSVDIAELLAPHPGAWEHYYME